MELSANGRYLAFTNSGVVRIVDFDRLLTGYTSLGASEVQQAVCRNALSQSRRIPRLGARSLMDSRWLARASAPVRGL